MAKSPATTAAPADLLTEARTQIKAANDAARAAKLYLDAADSRHQTDADDLKLLRDQLGKVGTTPAAPAVPKPPG